MDNSTSVSRDSKHDKCDTPVWFENVFAGDSKHDKCDTPVWFENVFSDSGHVIDSARGFSTPFPATWPLEVSKDGASTPGAREEEGKEGSTTEGATEDPAMSFEGPPGSREPAPPCSMGHDALQIPSSA